MKRRHCERVDATGNNDIVHTVSGIENTLITWPLAPEPYATGKYEAAGPAWHKHI